jgi:hypothetical protein
VIDDAHLVGFRVADAEFTELNVTHETCATRARGIGAGMCREA